MKTDRPFRFGVINETPLPARGWLDHVRRVESLGFDTFLIRDHLLPDFFGDQLAPLPALAAAAAATTTLRLGTLVLDNDFRHPAMLAKEAATIDHLSGGRLELGLGAGWLKREYDVAGIPYDSAGTRIGRLEESVQILKSLLSDNTCSFSGNHYQISELRNVPTSYQHPHPPILLGGGKPRMLRLAGKYADIVSLLTTSVSSGVVEDDPTERLAASVEQKIEWIRQAAGDRFPSIELSMIPSIVLTRDRHAEAQHMIDSRNWKELTPNDVLEMPSVFIGSPEEIAETMYLRRERYGVSYYVFSDRELESSAPIVRALSTRQRDGA
jgi:probable F420-dependent oxidoreductase